MNTLIHICGAARTGTTILGLALGQSPAAFYAGEIHAKFRPFRTHHYEPRCSCGKTPCHIWSAIGELEGRNYVNIICQNLDVDHVIDSSGDLPWLVDHNEWSKKSGYQVCNVLTWKEPVHLAYSQWKRGKPITNALRTFDTHYGRIIKLGLPFVSVEIGELVSDPESILKEICHYVGLSYDENMLLLPEPGHFLFGSSGVIKKMNKPNFKLGMEGEKDCYEEEFYDEFNRALIEHNRKSNLHNVVDVLKSRSIKFVRENCSEEEYIPLKYKPMWYYNQRLYRYFKGAFPDKV